MFTPEISVIMPNYNCEKHLEEAIYSIQKQDFTNWELIVIDDCSTDNSYHLISKLAELDNRIRAFKNQKRKGPGTARNIGLKNSKGRFIAFLDSDDYWPINRLSTQINAMKTKRLAISFGDYSRVFRDTLPTIRIKAANDSANFVNLLGNPIFSIITLMIDKNEIKKIPPFEDSIWRAEDYLFHLDLLKSFPIAYRIPEVLAYYRYVPSSNSSKGCMNEMWWIFKNRLGLSFSHSAWYFSTYIFNAIKRRIKIQVNIKWQNNKISRFNFP